MNFSSESEFQEHCLSVLKSKNIPIDQSIEDSDNQGFWRVIVAARQVYVFRRELTRKAIYQAYSHGKAYVQDNDRHLTIVGQYPNSSESELRSALNAANEIREQGVGVEPISEPFWKLPPSKKQGWTIENMLVVGVLVCMLISSIFTQCKQIFNPPSEQPVIIEGDPKTLDLRPQN
jgi:hypothetical protein